ncbi:MAG: hypothetical protein NTU49_02440, partial [Gammaproteobacteria bacterium]|nr:hypothetical protein [Gammaproteobacteria bacterium]
QIVQGVETDSDDEHQCETDTRAQATRLGYAYAGLFWKKPAVFPTGKRVFDDAVSEDIRDALQGTPPAGRTIKTVKINGTKTRVIQLETCETMTI